MIGDSNRVQIRWVREVTWGATPASAMYNLRITGETLNASLQYTQSEEIRSDRQTTDLIQTDQSTGGDVTVEISYGNADAFMEGALHNPWVSVFKKENLVSDSPISDVTATAITVDAGGAAVKQYHILRATGFTNSGNNRLIVAGTGSTATSIVITGGTVEGAPPAGAKLEVVGFQAAAAADIKADASGLTSTTTLLNSFGLVVGQWIKIGGTAAGNQFATTANNGWARIVSISATAIVLDNKPAGWTVDTATGKTIQIWFGNYLRNGVDATQNQFSIEREMSDLAKFFVFRGCRVNTMSINFSTGQILMATFSFLGKTGANGGTTYGTGSPWAQTIGDVFNAVSDVVSVREGGNAQGMLRSFSVQTNNNLREQKAVGTLGSVGIGVGRFEVSGSLEAYFEDDVLYNKYRANQNTSLSSIFVQDGQAYVVTIPNVKIESCTSSAQSGNQDMVLNMSYRGIRDNTTNCMLQLERFPYYEA